MSSAGSHPGLYIHIPFCITKCPYCDFYSITNLALLSDFADAIKKEAFAYKDRFGAFDSLYIGGGTPSCIDNAVMEGIFNAARHTFDFAKEVEITVEMNPDDVSEERLSFLRSLGINRISLGVQALDDRQLAFLKRRHGAVRARESISLVKSAGFTNFSIDLIYGLPGQSERSWLRTLEEVCTFRPAHLSCYELTIHKDTPFGEMERNGTLQPATETKQRRLFLATSQFLVQQGFLHYEVSNFARNKRFQSRHNRKYWRHKPYLGLGPGAHSFLGRERWWNVQSVERYCAMLTGGHLPVEGKEHLSADQLVLEKLFLGLRTQEGIPLTSIKSDPISRKRLDEFLSRGYLVQRRGRIIPSTKGYLIADRLPLLLFP